MPSLSKFILSPSACGLRAMSPGCVDDPLRSEFTLGANAAIAADPVGPAGVGRHRRVAVGDDPRLLQAAIAWPLTLARLAPFSRSSRQESAS